MQDKINSEELINLEMGSTDHEIFSDALMGAVPILDEYEAADAYFLSSTTGLEGEIEALAGCAYLQPIQ